MFESQVFEREPIYGLGFDAMPDEVVINGVVMGKGYEPRDFYNSPYGSVPHVEPFSIPLVPRDQWAARIEAMETGGTRLSDLCKQVNLPCKNQANTNYCWINAPTHCVEVLRAAQNQGYVELSPASVGAKIKNFRNVGGWGSEGLTYIVEHGLVPASIWPVNAISRSYDTPVADAERPKYRVTEWWDLRPRDLDQLMTCLFMRIPVAVGYDHWRHEVTAIDPVIVNGTYGVRIRNSWGSSWGEDGYGLLMGQKAVPDDAVAPRVAIPS